MNNWKHLNNWLSANKISLNVEKTELVIFKSSRKVLLEVNTKTLRNIYFVIFDSHLSYSCIVWAQNINTVRRLIVLQKKALRIMNFKDQLFHSSPLFSSNNILKFGDKIIYIRKYYFHQASQNIPINRQVPSIFNDWFTFSENLNRCVV